MTDITENDLDEEDAGPKPRVTDTPIEIWLQYGDELLVDTPHSTLARDGEVSWCDSQVFPFDVKYVRSDEVDRLRARVAELESARGEPVAWMNPYGGTLQVRITGLEYEKYTIPLYTAPPAQAVDVDAISDEAIEQGCEAMWAHSYRIADPGSMRAALRAIFNDDAKDGA